MSRLQFKYILIYLDNLFNRFTENSIFRAESSRSKSRDYAVEINKNGFITTNKSIYLR